MGAVYFLGLSTTGRRVLLMSVQSVVVCVDGCRIQFCFSDFRLLSNPASLFCAQSCFFFLLSSAHAGSTPRRPPKIACLL